MALKFEERLIEEWSDGVVVMQTFRIYCNSHPGEKTSKVFLQSSTNHENPKPTKLISGRLSGPRGGDRIWNRDELDQILVEWMETLSTEKNVVDYEIVSLIRAVVKSVYSNGDAFSDDPVRQQLLQNFHVYASLYTTINKPTRYWVDHTDGTQIEEELSGLMI